MGSRMSLVVVGTIIKFTRMECEEKARLVGEHHRAALVYAQLARALNASRVQNADHERLRATAGAARKASKEARAALERHQTEHGC